MKTADEIMKILVDEIETAERRWAYATDYAETERERERALDDVMALKLLYRKITGESFSKPA